MKINPHINPVVWRCLIILVAILVFAGKEILAQEPPPKPIQVTVTGQTLNFGAFTYALTTGSVIINADGSRSSSGTLILVSGYSYSTAHFQLVGNPGTVVTLLQSPDVSLIGSSGGTLTLQMGASNPATPFVITTTPPAYTSLYLGGILLVGNQAANPAGNYTGTYLITFVQE